MNHLRTFGEVGVVAHINRDMKAKLEDRGRPCMFVGYAHNHAGDVYRMLDLKTRKICVSRDVTWLKKLYGEYIKNEDKKEVLEDEEEEEAKPPKKTPVTVPPNVEKELKVQTNENLGTVAERSSGPRYLRSGKEIGALTWETFAQFNMALLSTENKENEPTEPLTFQEAWWQEDTSQRDKWRTAIKTEFNNMVKRGIWKKIAKANVQSGRTLLKSKWVFKIKRDGTYRARLVACGYSQVPGVDYTENYSPVVNDVTFRIILVIWIIRQYEARIIDIETAFLEGVLEEEIYMQIPKGYAEAMLDEANNECLLLQRPLYGLVQAARQFWKKVVSILKELQFVGGTADPCLFSRSNEKGTVIVIMYVDDFLCVGDHEALNSLEDDLRKAKLTLKVEHKMTDYLSCEIVLNEEKTEGYLIQPHLIRNLRKYFGEYVKPKQVYLTPGTPGHGVKRPESEDMKVDEELQKRFRSGVGMLLYLVKHSRPDIANATRELSKSMDGATMLGYLELLRVIKYVLDTEGYGLKLKPQKQEETWRLIAYTDSDWAGDQETRISVSGYVLYFASVAIAWRSKGQKCVTLSSSEAEYVALSECVKDVRFVMKIMIELGVEPPKPVVVRIDNVGAMFMAENSSTSQRTRHIDIRYKWVAEFIEAGEIAVVFVKTDDNDADIFTKNTSRVIHDKHVEKMMWTNQTP